ncbi:MAG: M56 family metallopeptidase [Planctomycetaceae bacterium]
MQSLATWFSTADRESLAALAIDAVIKSTVLLLMAATIAGLMRRSSAAVRHRTWCLTFAGLLVLPLLSYALPAWRIPVLPPAEQPAPPAAAVVAVEMPAVPAEPPASIGDASHDLDRFPGDAVRNWPADLESQGLAVPDAVAPVVDSTFSVADPEPAITVAEPQPERPLVTEQSVLALWMIGSGVVLFPLLVGLVHSAWLGMRARQVTDGTWTGLLDELRGRLHLQRRVKLLELTRPVIPMTWGVLRPVVIVPQAAQRWPERLRRFVLLHELAHVKRWDVPFQLLGRIACAVYWFHPLAWYALRRLRVERELACDDCVVTTGERPSDYAEQLLQIVRTCRPAGIASVGVAMARTSHLEGRIRAMFDKARSHVPLSARAARVLSIAAALLVTTVAVVRPAAREAEPVEPAVVADDPASAELPEAAEGNDVAAALDLVAQPEPSRQICRFRGIVRDESGKPIAGAKLEVLPNPLSHASGDGVQALTLGTTADDGRFDAEFEPDDFYGTAGEMLQVTAHGFGPAWLQADEAKLSENLEIQLTADTVPIEGQILDLEGNPVAGAQISVERIEIPRGDNLDQYLESVKADGGSNFQFATTVFKQKVIAPVTTDPQGRFRMTGIGRDRIVDLELQGKGLHQARMRVMTRAGEKVSPLDQEQSARGQRFGEAPVYGATFSYLAQPSRLIKGIVVDAETKAPLSGINIGSLESGASATSSGDGRFVLDGCVKADEYRLLASAPAGIPYMQGSQRVVDAAGLKPIEITFEMTRGVTVSGTVTDKDTGKPVAARVGYWPAYPNPHLRPGIGGMEANAVGAFSNAETNREGQFSLPVLPGPGFLCINANDREAYESASVDAAAFFRERDVKYFSLVDTSNLTEPILITAHSDAVSGAMPQRQFQAIELLNIDAAGVQEPRSIHLVRKDVKQANATTDLTAATTVAQAATPPAASDPAKSDKEQLVRGTVVDPTGQPVAGATIRVVRVKRSRWAGAPVDTTVLDTLTTSTDGRFEIPGAQSLVGNHQNGPYWEWTEIVATATGYAFGFQSLADASANEPIQIPLSPPQGLRGRIVDLEGRPIEGATLRLLSVAVGGTSDKINEWLDRVSKLPASPQRNILGRLVTIVEQTHFPRTGDAAAAAELFPTLQTDADGCFELDGIGRDRRRDPDAERSGPSRRRWSSADPARWIIPSSARAPGSHPSARR